MPHAEPFRTALASVPLFEPRRRPRPALVGALAAGAAAVAVTSALVAAGRELAPVDVPIGRALRGRRPRRTPSNAVRALDEAAGRDASFVIAAVAAALLAMRERGRPAALPVLASALATHGAHRVLRQLVRRPRPLIARLSGKRSPSFPSGHAARAAALLGTLAHVAVEERLVSSALAYPLAAGASLVAGGARVTRGRHWPTDVVGGVALGATIAAACAIGYEMSVRR